MPIQNNCNILTYLHGYHNPSVHVINQPPFQAFPTTAPGLRRVSRLKPLKGLWLKGLFAGKFRTTQTCKGGAYFYVVRKRDNWFLWLYVHTTGHCYVKAPLVTRNIHKCKSFFMRHMTFFDCMIGTVIGAKQSRRGWQSRTR
jgi:hypothetical protein